MRVEDKVALVTGAARGIGAAIASRLAQEGACVMLCDLLEDQATALAEELQQSGHKAKAVLLDVTSVPNWSSAVDHCESVFGPPNVLVNNAGIMVRNWGDDATVEEWDSLMDVNSKGAFLGIKAVVPSMRRAGGGSIINISSTSGLVGGKHHPGYHASKGASRLLTKAAAIQYAPDAIRVNSVHPGLVATPMNEAIRTDPASAAIIAERLPQLIPIGRIGQPEEIANGVLFLASDEASYITGSELVIDGGHTAQ